MRIWIHVALMLGPPALASLAIVTWGGDVSAQETPAIIDDQALAIEQPVVCDSEHPCMSLWPIPEQGFVTACIAE